MEIKLNGHSIAGYAGGSIVCAAWGACTGDVEGGSCKCTPCIFIWTSSQASTYPRRLVTFLWPASWAAYSASIQHPLHRRLPYRVIRLSPGYVSSFATRLHQVPEGVFAERGRGEPDVTAFLALVVHWEEEWAVWLTERGRSAPCILFVQAHWTLLLVVSWKRLRRKGSITCSFRSCSRLR